MVSPSRTQGLLSRAATCPAGPLAPVPAVPCNGSAPGAGRAAGGRTGGRRRGHLTRVGGFFRHSCTCSASRITARPWLPQPPHRALGPGAPPQGCLGWCGKRRPPPPPSLPKDVLMESEPKGSQRSQRCLLGAGAAPSHPVHHTTASRCLLIFQWTAHELVS